MILLGLAGSATATLSSQIRSRLALARAGSAYAAKMLCSGVLMAGMDDARLWREELSLARGLVKARILPDRGEVVTEALAGTVTARARRQANLGCSLHQQGSLPVALPAQLRSPSSDPQDVSTPWLLAPSSPSARSAPPGGIDWRALQAALQQSFQEPDPQEPRRTRAVVVVRDGWVVAERYAPGITAATPLIGWSVTKAVTHALIGIAVEEKLLKLRGRFRFPSGHRRRIRAGR